MSTSATRPKRDYCGCCGADVSPESANPEPWCNRCRKHVGKTGPAYTQTYFALNGRDCPFSAAVEGDY